MFSVHAAIRSAMGRQIVWMARIVVLTVALAMAATLVPRVARAEEAQHCAPGIG